MKRIRALTDLPFIRSAWQEVFKTNDPFCWPFQSKIPTARIFFPTDGYHLTPQQYSALTNALRQCGESAFCLSVVEAVELTFLDRWSGHWKCDLPTYAEYRELPLGLENTLYSESGSWGVLISHEMHAFIGGSAAFMSMVGDSYPNWDEDLGALKAEWSANPNAGWLEPVVPRLATS
jgi:hypothetical protein